MIDIEVSPADGTRLLFGRVDPLLHALLMEHVVTARQLYWLVLLAFAPAIYWLMTYLAFARFVTQFFLDSPFLSTFSQKLVNLFNLVETGSSYPSILFLINSSYSEHLA